jgi:hypothetical protein
VAVHYFFAAFFFLAGFLAGQGRTPHLSAQDSYSDFSSANFAGCF